MFLATLSDQEKMIFLELAHYIMTCDGETSDEELEMFQSYVYECQLKDYKIQNISFDELINSIKSSRKKKLRIIIIELMGIIMSDHKYDLSEDNHMQKIAQVWDFSEAQMRRMRRWTQDMTDVVHDGQRLIDGE